MGISVGKRQKTHLPEEGFGLLCGGSRVEDLAFPEDEDLEAVFFEFIPEPFPYDVLRTVGGIHVGHDETGIHGQGRFPVFPGEPALPQVSGDVHLDAASVSLVTDLSGPVFHHLETREGLLNGGMGGDSVSGEDGYDGAGIAFLRRKRVGEPFVWLKDRKGWFTLHSHPDYILSLTLWSVPAGISPYPGS